MVGGDVEILTLFVGVDPGVSIATRILVERNELKMRILVFKLEVIVVIRLLSVDWDHLSPKKRDLFRKVS